MSSFASSLPRPVSLSLARGYLGRGAAGVLALGLVCTALPSHADKPEWAGAGRREAQFGPGREHRDGPVQALPWQAPASGPRVEIRIGGYFGEAQRRVVVQDHARMVRAGHCPPGLAKKGTGCLPPGQMHKAYVLGQPLPPHVIYYDLPPTLAVRLGPPPAGHRFVRVAADILLIAVGTGMVIDAISDLGF